MRKDPTKIKIRLRKSRHLRVRARVRGTAERPRLSVFRSSKHMVLQLIDDEKGVTLFFITDHKGKKAVKAAKTATKQDAAFAAGKKLAELAVAKGVVKAIFDRGGYMYHGRVKAAAEGARAGGLKF